MQRIRYGLTGLAIVFFIVLIGTAVIRSGEEPHANNPAGAAAVDQPSEPLAELGVAPGEGSDNEGQANVVQPQRP
jgi:hypothetical protein